MTTISEKVIEMKSKFAGCCFRCNQAIAVGEEIAWYPNRPRRENTSHKYCPPMPEKPIIKEVIKEEVTNKNVLPSLPDGHFTVVFEFRGRRISRTLRLKTQPENASFAPGKQIIALLTGCDNEKDYTGFGFVRGNYLGVWKSKITMQEAIAAANVLLEKDSYKEAAKAYVLESGRCCRCNRLLTVEQSIERSMGPVCAKKMGF